MLCRRLFPGFSPGVMSGAVGMWIRPAYDRNRKLFGRSRFRNLKRDPRVHHAHVPVASKYLVGVDGAVKGTIIHEVLRGRDSRVVCLENGVTDLVAVSQCEEIAARFFSSELMKRVVRSYCEVPFFVTFSGTLVTGKIDRLCEMDNESFIVIDYKSEASADYTSLVEEYTLSLSVYLGAIRQIVQKPVTGWLYFTERGEYYEIEV